MDKTYAIIVLYNGMRNNWIKKCLDSIKGSSIEIGIIVVDNNSSDNGVAFIEANYPDVILIKVGRNLGFGGANNLGLDVALSKGGEYFILLNQDAYLERNTVETLLNESKKHPDYGVLSPMHLNGNGDALDYNFSIQIDPLKCKDLYSDIFMKKSISKLYQTYFVCAACWLLPKKTLRKVGGFSPTFFHYCEDDNYCNRVEFHGLKVGVYPEVFVLHDRENRPPSKFDDEFEQQKRKYLREISDPRNEGECFWVKKMLLYVLSNRLSLRLVRYYFDLMRTGKLKKVLMNKELSKTIGEYLFLKYNG